MANQTRALFLRRRLRVRNRLKKMSRGRLRMSVFRSAKNIYVQIIDDDQGKTLVSASTLESGMTLRGENNTETAARIGTLAAERAKAAGIEDVYFDRGGYLYHGRVKALADAAREAGLKF